MPRKALITASAATLLVLAGGAWAEVCPTTATNPAINLQMELFKNLSGSFITHIPSRGAGSALNGTVAGQAPMIFDNLP